MSFLSLVAVMAAGVTATAAAPLPKPGEVKVFGNWAAGCDNTGDCMAVSLAAGWDGPDPAPITFSWAARTGATPVIAIDGEQVLGGAIEIDGDPVIEPGKPLNALAARRMAAAMAKGREAKVNSRRGEDEPRSSLGGFAAALLYIEEQQGRTGTSEAILRQGQRPYLRKAALPPAMIRPRPGKVAVPKIDFAALYREIGCAEPGDLAAESSVTIARLDPRTSLVLVPWRCNNGAYNFHASVMLANNRGALRPARLDFPGGMSGEKDSNDLTNAWWDNAAGRLTSAPLGRGLGDCGTQNSYAWDGSRFRLISRAAMPDCRSATTFVPVWRMRVVTR